MSMVNTSYPTGTSNGNPETVITSLRENLAEKEKEIEELWERMFNLEKDYLCLKQLYETDLAARHVLRESRLNFRAARLKDRMDQLEYDRAGSKRS